MYNPSQRHPTPPNPVPVFRARCADSLSQSPIRHSIFPRCAIRNPQSEIAPISEQSPFISEQSPFISEQSAFISEQTALIAEQIAVILGFITVEFDLKSTYIPPKFTHISVICTFISRHFAILLRTYRNDGEKNNSGKSACGGPRTLPRPTAQPDCVCAFEPIGYDAPNQAATPFWQKGSTL